MSNEQEIQQLIYVYRDLEARLQAISNRLAEVETSQYGINATQKSINELKDLEAGHEIIIPIGNSAYIKAKIEDPKKFLISIGKDVMAERNPEQALEFARKIDESYGKVHKMLEDQLNEVTTKMEQIRPQIERYVPPSGSGSNSSQKPTNQ